MKCPKCGCELEAGKFYCSTCGTEIQYVPNYEPEIEDSIDTSIKTIKENFSPKSRQNFVDVIHNLTKLKIIILVIIFFSFLIIVFGIFNYTKQNSFDYQYKKAIEYADKKDYPHALSYLVKAIDLDKSNTDLILLESNYYLLSGFRDTAKSILENAIKSDLESYEIYETLIQMYIEDENIEAVISLIISSSNNLLYEKYKKYISVSPTFSSDEGTFFNKISLELLAMGNGIIYYTLNGTRPTSSSFQYMEPLYLEEGTYLISAMYVNEFGIQSPVISHEYTIDLSKPYAPDVNVYSGVTTIPQAIVIEIQEECVVLYSIDGSDLTENSFHYTNPIAMPLGNFILRCVTMNKNKEFSQETTRTIELIIPGEISTEKAISITLEHQIKEAKIIDATGKTNDSDGLNSYTTDSAFSYEKEPYFLVYEWHQGLEGVAKKTGNLFGVQMITGDFFNVAFDTVGNYRVY